MKSFLKLLLWVVAFFASVTILLYIFNVSYLIRAVRTVYLNGETTAFLGDYKEFPNREIKKGSPQPWNISKRYNIVKPTQKLLQTNDSLKTVAFLIIKNDSIWHESYFDNYTKDTKSNSFSMAKSIVTAAMGKAIMEGKIKSLDQKLTDFFPEYAGGFGDKVTIGDLSSMSSGLDWDEKYYSPFSITTRAYFDNNLNKVMLGLKIRSEPGKEMKYLSGNTQLLAMVLEKATGEHLSDYVSKNFWQPMGAENDALWQIDDPGGIEKAYCCIASNARDFARFGKLYKQKGNWNGQQILDTAFVEKCTTPRFADSKQYGYGWWLSDHFGKDIYFMQGHLGQYVIVIPEDDLIIVRLGHLRDEREDGNYHRKDFYVYIDEAYKMINSDRKN